MADETSWLSPAADGCVLRLWVVPGASRAGVAGVHGGALRLRVSAPPEGGAANREVLRLLADLLGVHARELGLEAGASGRRKRVCVRGLRVEEVKARLAPALSVDRPTGDH